MSQTAFLFFSMAAAFSVLMAWVVLLPWRKKGVDDGNALMAVNVATFKTRLTELDGDHAAGLIEKDEYDGQVLELKRQLLAADTAEQSYRPASKKSRLIVLCWVPILAMLLYLLGDRTSVFTLWQAQERVGQVADDLLTAKIDTPPEWATSDSTALISAMQTNVHRHAYDPNRWMRLSELFLSLQATPQALEALARAYRLAPDDDTIASTYAQISFFANEGQLTSQSQAVIAKLLAANPTHEGAMMLLAMGETRAGNYEAAQGWVTRLSEQIRQKEGDHSTALASLDRLQAQISTQAQAKTNKAPSTQAPIKITISVDDSLRSVLTGEESVFVTARANDGTPPYAVKKLPATALNGGEFMTELSDQDAMMAGHDLSKARQTNTALVLGARISATGSATPQAGDYAAESVPLDGSEFTLHINQPIP